MKRNIEIKGARIHNLRHIDVTIPKNRLTVITGVSGSGKSSLAFDTLYEEGRKRYLMFSGTQLIVDSDITVDDITGLSPTVAVEQRIIRQSNPRSTVSTRTQIEALLSSLYANFGVMDEGYGTGEPLEAVMFQKNSPKGMCPRCMGKGYYYRLDEEKMIPDKNIRIDDLFSDICDNGTIWRVLERYRRTFHKPTDITFAELSEEDYEELMFGQGKHFKGLAQEVIDTYAWSRMLASDTSWTKKLDCCYREECKLCEGTGLGPEAAHTRIGGRTITEAGNMYLDDLLAFLNELPMEKSPLQKELERKLKCLCDVGLSYLSLNRTLPSLSGGEIQRLFLASYIISEIDSIIFVFDEPTIGLHENEKQNLLRIIRKLIDEGNTVVCVEHDETFIKAADHIIDIGPDAGVLGGRKIFEGSYQEFVSCKNSRTAPYLSGDPFPIPSKYRLPGSRMLSIRNADIHNLQNVSVDIPLGVMVGIAGVSGSGKSSLIAGTLVPGLKALMQSKCITGDEKTTDRKRTVAREEEDFAAELDYTGEGLSDEGFDLSEEGISDRKISEEMISAQTTIAGHKNIKKCYVIDQRPIGRSRTSCPATYTGIMDRMRKLFSESPEAKARNMGIGWFSLNSKGGCPDCHGDGVVRRYIGFGNFIDIKCSRCGGYGFVADTMSVHLDGKTIRDCLEMTVSEAYEFFKDKDDAITNILNVLIRVGMGYIKLGQKTPTISGGESQRIKLAKELSKGKAGKDALYILDEPSTGLSFYDCEKLQKLLNELVDMGNSVIVTEHDTNMLSNCDWIIEMGPGGGRSGGRVIAQGTPAELKENTDSVIGKFLKTGKAES